MRLLFPCILNVLDPEVEVAMEFACGSVENEENSALSAMSSRPNSQSLDSLLAQGIEIHLVFDISYKVDRLCTARIELVLEVRSFLDDRGNLILVSISEELQRQLASSTYLCEYLLALIIFELRN